MPSVGAPTWGAAVVGSLRKLHSLGGHKTKENDSSRVAHGELIKNIFLNGLLFNTLSNSDEK